MLFSADQSPSDLADVIAVEENLRALGDAAPSLATEQGEEAWSFSSALGREAWEFACELSRGTWSELARIDAKLDELAVGWTVPRMAAADRALLRLAVFEMLWRDDVPIAVTINEVVELAKQYGTDDSPKFINGILGTLARQTASAAEPGG